MDGDSELDLPERLAHITDYEPKDRCVRCGRLSEVARAYGRDGKMSIDGPFCLRCLAYYRYRNDRKYRSRIRAGNTRREALERGATPRGVSFTVDEVGDQDGWVCQICKDPVDPDADRNTAAGASIDHIIPLSRGGTHEPSNAQLAHRSCNSRKGNRLPGEPGPRHGSEDRGSYVLTGVKAASPAT